ncbi:uncharacterized protein E0L32_000578 [Thyridium curvatum]|uniref:Telomerase reverse transcriptase n=1 Tax=Thyridium curvatum TaxID=1093900 RepID=A0A507B636_9PEZI|nr:uncharacterized protein E0L32_000578 [Thyridium curvatum]TPX14184.1 hypothetical protein E0L32_000578 [Thyridium curvatum]
MQDSALREKKRAHRQSLDASPRRSLFLICTPQTGVAATHTPGTEFRTVIWLLTLFIVPITTPIATIAPKAVAGTVTSCLVVVAVFTAPILVTLPKIELARPFSLQTRTIMAAPRSRKRKQAHGSGADDPETRNRPRKRPKVSGIKDPSVKHILLAQHYPRVQTLRDFLLAKLPTSSKIRRRKIAALGSHAPEGKVVKETEVAIGRFLDSTLVTGAGETRPSEPDDRWEKWVSFSQRGDESYVTLSDGPSGALFSQSEIVDFVIWLLFEREKKHGKWPKHLLCDGYRRTLASNAPKGLPPAANTIPGLFCVHPNPHVQTLKEDPWPQVLLLLGQAGERVMIDLLFDCSIFVAMESGQDNLHQLSGKPLFDLEPLSKGSHQVNAGETQATKFERKPTEMVFVRSRLFYARAALNARGLVHFGLRHIHALNRFTYRSASTFLDQPPKDDEVKNLERRNAANTVKVMMYIFPRQFGLHNAFTSMVDFRKTAQKFQDYTLREDEVSKLYPDVDGKSKHPVPKRLWGEAKRLVERLQILHNRCSYSQLLQHYCPSEALAKGSKKVPSAEKTASSGKTKKRKKPQASTAPDVTLQYTSLADLATPIAHVSAFCQAVLKRLIPNEFWGTGDVQTHNKDLFLTNVDRFVKLRRFESMNLHDLRQGFKVTEIEWLAPPKLKGQKLSRTDMDKRNEIFLEFLYYTIDSLLIPLIRSNFYVTESNVHRHRLFYFRHDIWRYVAEPAMAALKAKMFEEVKLEEALQILNSRQLGFSQVRLLPKDTTMRPITNLRRRTVPIGNTKILGPSINAILGPVHTVLTAEKNLHPERLGATLFSVSDIYKRLKGFKQGLPQTGQKFYFAKVDVQAAFDTIPQSAVIELMNTVPSHKRYQVLKHVELKPGESAGRNGATAAKASRRWRASAKAAGDDTSFLQIAERQHAPNRRNTVFVDNVVTRQHDSWALLALMSAHVRQNLVKIGKKFYRQRDGIPQGSVLSSLLCNYFYADLEAKHLGFLRSEGCLLLRLIDDFLLITTDAAKASRFVEVMHGGFPAYGVTVSPGKSLVNFELEHNGSMVKRIRDGEGFPYCGTLLDCSSLEIMKDRLNFKDPVVTNSLTVEFSRFPGQNFKRKVLNAFKIQSHLMFFDTTHNAPCTALRNIHGAFCETATKMWAYARCLPKGKQPSPRLVVDTIKELIDVAYMLLAGKSRRQRYPGYKFGVRRAQVAWLALHAFRRVLARKQSRYGAVIAWLDGQMEDLEQKEDVRMPQGAVA